MLQPHGQCADCKQQRADDRPLQHRPGGRGAHRQRGDQFDRGADQHHKGEGAGIPALLAQPQPIHAGAFDRPRGTGPLAFEPERNGEGAENDADDGIGLGQQRKGRPLRRIDQPRQQQVEETIGNGGERRTVFPRLDQEILQTEGGNRRTENQGAIDPRQLQRPAGARSQRLFRREFGIAQAVDGEAQADKGEKQQEEDEEGLDGAVKRIFIAVACPGADQGGGADKADEVEYPPGTEPRHRADADIKHGQVGEQRRNRTATGRDQYRRGKSFDRRDDGENTGVLQHCQHGA